MITGSVQYGANVQGYTCMVPVRKRMMNVQHALSLGLPEVKVKTKGKDKALVLGAAPSINAYADEIRRHRGPIYAVNAALGWCLKHSITPTGWVTLDPLPQTARYIENGPDITYYVASCCDPTLFKALAGRHVVLWHALSPDLPLPGCVQVGGGGTSATRAPMLAWLLGANRVTLYGVDSSFEASYYADGRDLSATRADPANDPITVEFDGVSYRTTRGLLQQATYLQYMVQRFPGRLRVKGEGLAPDLIASLERVH